MWIKIKSNSSLIVTLKPPFNLFQMEGGYKRPFYYVYLGL